MSRVLAATVLWLALISPAAVAQTPTSVDEDSNRTRENSSREERAQRARAPEWRFDVFASGIYDTNVEFSANEINSTGLEGGARVRFDNHRSWPTFTAQYGIARHHFEATDRWNRTSHNLRLAAIQRFLDRKLRLETVGQVQIKGWTVDRELADIYLISPRLDYRPNDTHRLRIYAAWREKQYDENDPSEDDDDAPSLTGRDAESPFAGLSYRYSFRPDHYLELGGRVEENDAQSDFFDYGRVGYSFDYRVPFRRRDELRIGIDYRIREYESRFISSASRERRVDHRLTPSLVWVHNVTANFTSELAYIYDQQDSNQRGRDYDAHRLALTGRYSW